MRVPTILTASLAVMLGTGAFAQQSLYSNSGGNVTDPGIATGVTTASGQASPQGSMWSELQTDGTGMANAAGGFACHDSIAGAYRLADNFIVTAGPAWTLTSVSVYAFQTGASQSPFGSANVRIWSGRPGDVGSVVVWGDAVTNRLQSVTSTNVYRVFNTVVTPVPPAPDTTRAIWKIDLGLTGAVLNPGTYWIDWQIKPSVAGLEAFSPAVTLAGARSKAASNARQFKPTGAWADLVDLGKPVTAADVAQDLPFILWGYAGNAPCPSDINGDGFVNGDDYDTFADAFAIADPKADFDRNGFVNGDDYDAFVLAFNAGC